MDQFNKTIEERDKKAAWDAIVPISFSELKIVIDKWMLIVDSGVIKLLIATIFANRLPSDPCWLFLIAPSSGGKTELLNGLLKDPDCYFLSQLTPNTLLSGYKGSKDREPSLLHQLGTNKTIIFKDFTSLLEGNKDAFKEILGQLREVFDQYITKRLGTGDEISWRGKMGFIAGCTPILEQRMNLIGAMGERFLSYSVDQPRRQALRNKMRENIGKEAEMREEIQNAMAGCLKGLSIPEQLPKIPEEVDTMIESLTDFIAISRAVVMRGQDTKKEIEYVVMPEGTGRTYKQLYTMALALMLINGGTWMEEDATILRKLAISSIHSIRYHLIRRLMAYKTQVKTSTMAMELGYPTTTTRRYLEDLAAITMDNGSIRILNRLHQGKGKPDLWQVTTEMKEILKTMGENVEATKEDTGFENSEEDLPVGVAAEEVEKQKEVEELTGDMSSEEIQRLGL